MLVFDSAREFPPEAGSSTATSTHCPAPWNQKLMEVSLGCQLENRQPQEASSSTAYSTRRPARGLRHKF